MHTDTLELKPEQEAHAQPGTLGFTLTADQQAAMNAFHAFLLDPVESVFVLSGYSGCGKSTLVRTLLDQLPGFQKAIRLVNPNSVEYEPVLTATTNKAAENLAQITGYEVKTIHSKLGLRVNVDYKTNTTTLIARSQDPIEHTLLFIDEASYIDKELLGWIFKRTRLCKIVFIGDPAQLSPVKSNTTPVFDANFIGASLTTVVRQAEGNPIVDLSTKFRHTVNTGEWIPFRPDGHHIRHMDRSEFNKAIEAEFTRPGWRYADSKILAYTNRCVVAYNKYVRNLAKGDPHFQVGDYAVCNSFLSIDRKTIKTDQLVQITDIGPDIVQHGVPGNIMTLDYYIQAFQPKNLADQAARLKQARAADEFNIVAEIESCWIDLRGAYSCTVNKSQGSTFGSVFIDLDDIVSCTSGNQIARMLYVAVSRAKSHVFLVGDLA